jgi:outer membrane immunogenic protein
MKSRTLILSLALTGAAAGGLLVAPAKAADAYSAAGSLKDVPFVSASNWTGFYAGVNGGGGWAANDVLSDNDGAGHSLRLSPKGGFGGGQFGYNAQGGVFAPRAVLGIEADVQGAGIDDSGTVATTPTREKASLNWFGTLRGRAGYAFDTSLVYVTGGLAFGEVDHQVSWLTGGKTPIL